REVNRSWFLDCRIVVRLLRAWLFQSLEHPGNRHLAISFQDQVAHLVPIGVGIDPQRHPTLTSRIRRGKKTVILKQLVLPIEADLQSQSQAFLVLAETGEHLLAGAKR